MEAQYPYEQYSEEQYERTANGLKEDNKSASIGVDAFYLNDWQFTAKYAWYFGRDEPRDGLITDRDNLSIVAKYRF